MRISGVMPLRNVVRLGYPFELAVIVHDKSSARHMCRNAYYGTLTP